MAYVIRKSQKSTTRLVDSQTPINRIQDAIDANFGTLDETKDGLFVSYDSQTDKFVLTNSDELLSIAASDQDIPDPFVRVLEGEINLGSLFGQEIDAGEF
jgi:hypothetical protein